MPLFILMTAEQADIVRGPSSSNPSAALNPIERVGPAFIFGVAVLGDAAHEQHWALLGALPQMDSSDPDFPPPLGDL